MARAKLPGATKIVLAKLISAVGSIPPFHRIAEIYFPSIEGLQACAATQGAKETIVHAISISNGGPPLFMIAETETIVTDARPGRRRTGLIRPGTVANRYCLGGVSLHQNAHEFLPTRKVYNRGESSIMTSKWSAIRTYSGRIVGKQEVIQGEDLSLQVCSG